jgi:hypothetical protein
MQHTLNLPMQQHLAIHLTAIRRTLAALSTALTPLFANETTAQRRQTRNSR